MPSNAAEYSPNPNIPDLIREARSHGWLLHDMRDLEQFAEVLEWFAQRGMYTTNTPPYPGNLKEVRHQNATEDQIATLVSNSYDALHSTGNPIIEETRLAPKLTDLFLATDVYSIHGLHVVDPQYNKRGKMVDGTVTTDSVTFTVNEPEEQSLLHDFFYGMTQTGDLRRLHMVKTGVIRSTGQLAVHVTNLNEYNIRIIEHAVAGMVAADDFLYNFETRLPAHRAPLSWLIEKDRETFHPIPMARMVAVNAHYQRMQRADIINTYRGDMPRTVRYTPNYQSIKPDIKPMISLQAAMARSPEALAQSPAAIFEVLRKAINAVAREMRGSGRFNQEQHPDPALRLLIEKGVDLRREIGEPGEPGPPQLRALKESEIAARGFRTFTAAKKEHPLEAFATTAVKAFSLGADMVAEGAIKATPWASKKGRHWAFDLRDYREKQDAALDSGKLIDKLLDKEQQAA